MKLSQKTFSFAKKTFSFKKNERTTKLDGVHFGRPS
jgi:hypothetical protein